MMLLLLVCVLTVVFCLVQVADLLARRDEEFPDRSGRLIWCIVIIFLPGIGALLYWAMKPRDTVESSDALKKVYADIRRQQGDRVSPRRPKATKPERAD